MSVPYPQDEWAANLQVSHSMVKPSGFCVRGKLGELTALSVTGSRIQLIVD